MTALKNSIAAILFLLEGGAIFGAAYALLSAWGSAAPKDGGFLTAPPERALAFSFCCLAALYTNGLYRRGAVRSLAEVSPRLFRSVPLMLLFLGLIYTLVPQSKIPPAALISGVAAVTGLLWVLRASVYGLLQRRAFLKRVVILGNCPLVGKLIREIERQIPCQYVIAAIVDDSVTLGRPLVRRTVRRILEQLGYPYMGPLRHLRKIVEEVRPERIIVAPAVGLDRPFVRQILLEARSHGIVVEHGAEVYERLTGKVPIEWLTPESLVFSKNFRRSGFDQALARISSLVAAIMGLIVFAPLMAGIAVAIKLDSRGPVLFVQERVGRRGRTFKLLKFRTMHPARRSTSEWAEDNADRITRVGKWLRKFRFDELPQFVNIFKGDMNLIGPRPHPVSNFELFVLVSRNAPECGQPIPYYSLRSMVRPGITGWAQIRYRYANGLEEEIEKMRYDLYYIKHMSFWFDLCILVQTIKVVLFGQESRRASCSKDPPASRPEPRLESAA
jgi:exopolysaccharide biosynthesis polyprenyl glycosylphosphotransferase